MGTILNMLRRFEALDTDKICIEALQETKETIADLNAEQMNKGQKADGKEINPQYSQTTVEIKRKKGQPTDRVTLKDTGAFYQGIYVSVDSSRVVTESTDSKSTGLQKKYGENIFGLNDLFKREYLNEKLRPSFKNKIELATGLTMK